jgi:glycerate kinase
MRIVIAPDKLKDSLAAPDVAAAIAAGVRRAVPSASIDLVPVSDGGEGFVRTMAAALGGELQRRVVTGPLPEMKVEAEFALVPGEKPTAVIEMSSAAGLALLPLDQRDPTATTTFGVGELMRAAVEAGARKILLGIGGSATCDAGIGCAQACGLPVLMADGEPVYDSEPLCGRDVERVLMVKHGRGSRVEGIEITVACDVRNPLFGPTGSAFVYAPQKGASPSQVEQLDRALRQLATRQQALPIAQAPGAGAAGGLGFGMMAFFNAVLVPGAAMVLEAIGLRRRLEGADLCLSAEGRVDEQSASGKATHAVVTTCRSIGVPCVVLAGSVGNVEAMLRDGAAACVSIANGPNSLADMIAHAPALLADAAEQVTRVFLAGRDREGGWCRDA